MYHLSYEYAFFIAIAKNACFIYLMNHLHNVSHKNECHSNSSLLLQKMHLSRHSRVYRQEMLRRYPDAEATMGDGRRVGETGPDDAGNLLSPTTVKV